MTAAIKQLNRFIYISIATMVHAVIGIKLFQGLIKLHKNIFQVFKPKCKKIQVFLDNVFDTEELSTWRRLIQRNTLLLSIETKIETIVSFNKGSLGDHQKRSKRILGNILSLMIKTDKLFLLEGLYRLKKHH